MALVTLENLQWNQNKFGEAYIESVNKSAFKTQASTSVFHKHFSEAFKEDETLYIIVGTDSGLLLKHIQNLSKELPKSQFLFVEFNQIIEEIIGDFDKETYDRIHLVNEEFDPSFINELFSNYLVTGKIELLRSIAVLDAKSEEDYGMLWHKFQEDFQRFMVVQKNALDSRPFIDAILLNVTHNLEPLINHVNCLSGGTALILGGGPSLDEALPWIKEVRDSLILFSAGRIARRLNNEGLSPDFFVSVDPYDVSFDNSKGIYKFTEESILLNGNHISPRILSQWSGPSSYMAGRFPWHNKGGEMEKNVASPGPNVINTAINAAVELGCTQIILAGVDLCFPLGKAYESSSDESKVGGRFTFKGVSTVTDNRGELAETQPAYANARDGLEVQVGLYRNINPKLKFINTGLYSAAINDVEYIAPDEINQRIEIVDKRVELQQLKQALDLPLNERKQRVSDGYKELEKQRKRFKRVVDLANDGIKAVKTLYKDGVEDAKSVKQALKAQKKLNSLIGDDGDMLFRYDASAFSENFRPLEEGEMQQSEIEQQLSAFFNGVLKSSKQFLQQLERAIKEASITKEEVFNNKDFGFIQSKWEARNVWGRVHNFVKWHPELKDNHAEAIQVCTDTFLKEIENTDTRHVQNLKEKSKDLTSLISRVEKAYDQKNRVTLTELAEHLQSLDEDEKVLASTAFVKGLIADLDGDHAVAVAELQKANHSIVNEKALLRRLAIHMQHREHELSLQTLEALCGVSLSYMVPYADLLKTIGHLDNAIQVLEIYVQQESHDFAAWSKLIEYISVNDLQRAHLIACEVLPHDPENVVIQHYAQMTPE